MAFSVITYKYPYPEKKLSVNQRNKFNDGIGTAGKNCQCPAMILQQTTRYAKKALQVINGSNAKFARRIFTCMYTL